VREVNLLFERGRNYASRLRSKNNFDRVENSLAIQAFTLIELTLVTVIIMALVGLSIPIFKKTFLDLSAKDAVFNISKLISYAQEKSVIDRKNYKVTFDFVRRQYQLYETTRTAEGVSYKKVKGWFGKLFTLPPGLSFSDSKFATTQKDEKDYKRQMLFYPDGHCDELLLSVVDAGGRGYSVAVKGFGSLARIKEVTGEIQE
jgi:hypothetical protein